MAALLGVGLCVGAGGAVPGQAPRYEAESVILDYFTALRTGDVNALGQVLGGELRTSRSELLRNPDYGPELVRDYGDAEFEILGLRFLDSGDALATVDIWLQPSERLRYLLTLRREGTSEGFRIVGSEFVP